MTWLLGSLLFLATGCGLLEGSIDEVSEIPLEIPIFDAVVFHENYVQPVTLSVATDDQTPSYTTPVGTLGQYGVLLAVDQIARDAGGTEELVYEVTNFTLTAATPIHFSVAVGSEDGRIFGAAEVVTTPESVAACEFDLDPASATAAEYSANMTACFRAWVDANGFPLQLQFTVTTSVTSSTANFALTEGPAPTYSHVSEHTMSTKNEVAADCDTEFASKLDEDVRANADLLEFNEISIAGYGASTETIALAAFARVYDSDSKMVGRARLTQVIVGNTRYWIDNQVSTTPAELANFAPAGNVNPTYTPSMPDFAIQVINGLAGVGTGGEPGSGFACWTTSGGAPRAGYLHVEIAGTGNVNFDGTGAEQ